MSGDVQPRKRKDKKKKKDELSLDEPRGTAAALGEGDVFMHSYHEHGTGGHWCAKIIFFSLLAVLITLIGLIILENRGLSELEANAVESRYSGILEGWLEDAPGDDHHDEHTLELKHHDDEEEEDHDGHDEYGHGHEHEDEDEHGDEEDEHGDDEDEPGDDEDEDEYDEDDHGDDEYEHGNDEVEENEYEQGEDENEDEGLYEEEDHQEEHSQQDLDDAEDEDEDDRRPYKYYDEDDDEDEKEENEDDNNNENEDQDEYEQDQNDDENEDNNEDDELNNDNNAEDGNGVGGGFEDELDENLSNDEEDDEKNEAREDEDEHEDDDEEDEELEVEKIEQEALEEGQEPISIELPALPEEDEADDGKDNEDEANDSEADDNADDADSQEDDDFLEADDEPPIVERITAPAGKPYVEVEEDEDSTEKPPDTLEEEEEYEKQQEEKRKEEEESSHMWLKLSVGGALLLATHAVMRRATAPRDEAEEERVAREATPVDRRMTLLPEEATVPVIHKKDEEPKKPVVAETVRQAPVFKAPPPPFPKPESEVEDIEEPEEVEEEELEELEKEDEKAELYSDEEIEEQIMTPQKASTKHAEPPKPKPEPEDEVPDDVEIIDDEQIEEEEVSEEEEEEEISDVDDAELLSRLEAKYGRLSELERAGQKHKDGGNNVEDDWPGEPADAYWRDQLDSAEQQLRQGAWSAAMERANSPQLQRSARAKYIIAASLDRLAEAQRDNRVLSRAIAAYLEVLKISEHLSDRKLLDVAKRALDRIQFRGNYLNAEPVYRLLIRRFPDEPGYRNNLTISYLMANRADLAEDVLKETLTRWPNNRVALAHYGFVLKVNNNKFEEAVEMFEKALEGDKGPACEPRFYYHYGDALLLLGRFKEAHEVHKRGAKHGHFLSPAQRSLYNVPRLKSKPWWNVEDTPYLRLAKSLERSWKNILKEGEAAKALYEQEKEGLKERGEWSQMDLFVRGQELPGRCNKAPVTCSIVKSEIAAAGCRRGQIKFSAMEAGTHVRPHVGPTNCRLRMHLGLSNTKDTYLRVDQETRQWQEGKVLVFDDSFEHEVWHNGTGKRMVLIVDVWHPDLTPQERRSLPAI